MLYFQLLEFWKVLFGALWNQSRDSVTCATPYALFGFNSKIAKKYQNYKTTHIHIIIGKWESVILTNTNKKISMLHFITTLHVV